MGDPISQRLCHRSMLALPAIALGLVLSGSATLGAPAAGDPNDYSPYSPPQGGVHRPLVQKHHHRFSQRAPVRHARLHYDPDEKAPPAAPVPASPHQGEEASVSGRGGAPASPAPGSAYAMKIISPAEAPLATHTEGEAATVAPAQPAPPAEPTTQTASEPLAQASERVATSDSDTGAVTAPAAPVEDPAPAAQGDEAAPAPAIGMMLLFGTCGAAAAGCIALVAFGARRRKRAQALAPPRRSPGRLLSSRDRAADRASMQRLFPHQFGAAIRG